MFLILFILILLPENCGCPSDTEVDGGGVAKGVASGRVH